MKYFLLSAVTIVYISLLSSCKEVGPDINLHGNANSVSDTSYIESPVATPAAKNVLIEEFTGVQCPNCPSGHVLEAGIEAQYPGRISGAALHPTNSLGSPFPFSLQNLEDPLSTSLYSYLGVQGPDAEPCAAIDRQIFSGQPGILMLRDYWTASVATELALTPLVNLVLTDIYNPANRQVTVVLQVHYTQDVSQPNNITITLTEDSVITAQLNGANIDTFYVHNNVLRTILTGTDGDNVAYNPNVTLVAGRVVQLVYQTTLNTLWNPGNMHITAFVHEHALSQVVYQAAKIKL
jgi:hypothetical protein